MITTNELIEMLKDDIVVVSMPICLVYEDNKLYI